MSERFWRSVAEYATKKAASYHKHSRKCPNCNTWTAAVGGCVSLVDDGDWHELMECIQCGFVSRWCLGSMLPYLDPPAPEQSRSCNAQSALSAGNGQVYVVVDAVNAIDGGMPEDTLPELAGTEGEG